MPDPSNPTSRVMDVLKFIAAHPTETFTLAEIAKYVGLTNGSAHRLLTTLAAGQFLSRDEKHRTYSLGVAMVAIGQAAIEKHRGIDIARREATRLSVELDTQCSVNALVENDLVVLVKEGKAQSHFGLTKVGERRPLTPPLGLCHDAWASEDIANLYVEQASPYLRSESRKRLIDAFPLIRERGYSIAAKGQLGQKSRQATALSTHQARDDAYWKRLYVLVGELLPDEIQIIDLNVKQKTGISYLSAPVFSPQGKVAFVIVLSGIPTNLDLTSINSYSERLCAAAATITSEIHGHQPVI